MDEGSNPSELSSTKSRVPVSLVAQVAWFSTRRREFESHRGYHLPAWSNGKAPGFEPGRWRFDSFRGCLLLREIHTEHRARERVFIVQWTERRRAKPEVQVRFLLRTPLPVV